MADSCEWLLPPQIDEGTRKYDPLYDPQARFALVVDRILVDAGMRRASGAGGGEMK